MGLLDLFRRRKQDPSAAVMSCPHCGKRLDATAQERGACTSCGRAIDTGAMRQAADEVADDAALL